MENNNNSIKKLQKDNKLAWTRLSKMKKKLNETEKRLEESEIECEQLERNNINSVISLIYSLFSLALIYKYF